MQNSDNFGLIDGFTNAWKWSIIFRFLASTNTAGNSMISNLKYHLNNTCKMYAIIIIIEFT